MRRRRAIAPLLLCLATVGAGAALFARQSAELAALRAQLAAVEARCLAARSAPTPGERGGRQSQCDAAVEDPAHKRTRPASTASVGSTVGTRDRAFGKDLTMPLTPAAPGTRDVALPAERLEPRDASDHDHASAPDERYLDQLEARFAEQLEQGLQASPTVSDLGSTLRRLVPHGTAVADLVCAGDLCRIELDHDDPAALERFSTVLLEAGGPDTQQVLQTVEEDGAFSSTLFLSVGGRSG